MMMSSSFRGYPPSASSALSSSSLFISNTKLPLHCPRLAYDRCYQFLTCCGFHGSFGSKDPVFFSSHEDSSCARRGENNFHSSRVCKSYGVNDHERSPHSTSYGTYNGGREQLSPPCRKYSSTESEGYGTPESFDRKLHRSMGALEGFGGEASRDSIYRGVESLNTDFSATSSSNCEYPALDSHGRPRSNFRQSPVRADRLYEIVSRSNEAHGNYNNFSSLSGDVSLASHGHISRKSTDFSLKNVTVSVFWDLDNKPPTTSPYEAGLSLRHAASQFGFVVDMVAYANRHAFTHIPGWVREERRSRKQLDFLEQKGIVQPDTPYVCKLCGRKCKTNLLLKRHFKQLHEREHNKRMSRLNSLKGKKKEKYKVAMQPKTQRYKEVASPILVPKVGYGLESDLRRAGIFVKTVQYKPQAADIELKKQMVDSMHKGVNCICLVSDDMDFSRMLADARALNLLTVVFGESRSLKRYADFWFSWDDICRGVPAQDLQEAIRRWVAYHAPARQRDLEILAGTHSDDSEVEHKVFGGQTYVRRAGFSAFSEEEQITEGDAYGSASDDDMEWSFDDEDGELDDDVDDDVLA